MVSNLSLVLDLCGAAMNSMNSKQDAVRILQMQSTLFLHTRLITASVPRRKSTQTIDFSSRTLVSFPHMFESESCTESVFAVLTLIKQGSSYSFVFCELQLMALCFNDQVCLTRGLNLRRLIEHSYHILLMIPPSSRFPPHMSITWMKNEHASFLPAMLIMNATASEMSMNGQIMVIEC